MFQVRDLSASIANQKLFENANLAIKQGEVVGLIGDNGVGKTTFFNLVFGVLDNYQGEFAIDQQKLNGLTTIERIKLGLVRGFRYNGLFQEMTVFENYLLAKYSKYNFWQTILADIKRSSPKVAKRESQSFRNQLNKFNLRLARDHTVSKLSGGQRKILELCLIDLRKPKYIFLDEPMAGVSKQNKNKIIKIIQNWKSQNIAVLIIEHDQEFIQRTCDLVYRIHNYQFLVLK